MLKRGQCNQLLLFLSALESWRAKILLRHLCGVWLDVILHDVSVSGELLQCGPDHIGRALVDNCLLQRSDL